MNSDIDGVPELVHHYTSIAGLYGILKDEMLWASMPQYLNDGLELKYGREELAAGIRSEAALVGARPPVRDHPDVKDRRDQRQEFGLRIAAGLEQAQSNEEPLYVASFSEKSDSGPLWQAAYGLGGCSIAFRTEALRHLPSAYITRKPGTGGVATPAASFGLKSDFVQVSYGPEALGPMVARVAPQVFPPSDQAWNWDTILDRYAGDRGRLAALKGLLSVKNESFRHEHEWRLTVHRDQHDYWDDEVPAREDVRFTGTTAIPYVSIPIDRTSFIDHVVAGPTFRHDPSPIEEVLRVTRCQRYISVRSSNSSFRIHPR